MSLILAQSNKFIYDNDGEPISQSGEQASNFICRFKDPIVLEPHSQIEVVGATLQNTSQMMITEHNQHLEFQIGQGEEGNALIPVVLSHGIYTPQTLANALTSKIASSNLNTIIQFIVSFNESNNRFEIFPLNDNQHNISYTSKYEILTEEEQIIVANTANYTQNATTKIIRGDRIVNGEFGTTSGQVKIHENLGLTNPHNEIKTLIGSRPGTYEEANADSPFQTYGCQNVDTVLKSTKGVFTGDGHQHLIIKPHSQVVLDKATFLGSNRDCQLYRLFLDTHTQTEARTWTSNADTTPSTVANVDDDELTTKFTSLAIGDKVYIQSNNTGGTWSINGYKIASGTDINLAPKSWKIYGSANPIANGGGTLLHTVSGGVDWRSNWNTTAEATSNWRNERAFYFNNATLYQYYWIEIDENMIGTNQVEIAYLTWINDWEDGGTSLETTANYTGSNGYDTRINHISSDNYYLKFVGTADKNTYTWGTNSIRNFPYNHLLIVNKTDKAITNDISQNDFVCILDGANAMNKSNLSTYKAISRATGITDDFRLTWAGTALTAFLTNLSIELMNEYPTSALGFNRYDNLEGDYFQFNNINSRTSVINYDSPANRVQPLSDDSEVRRVYADAYCMIDNNDNAEPQVQANWVENLLYKLDGNSIQNNNREHKTASLKVKIVDILPNFVKGDTLMITGVFNYSNQISFYLSHDTQGNLEFTQTEAIAENKDDDFPLTLSSIHTPIINTLYLNAGFVHNESMYLVQGKHDELDVKDSVNMNKLWNSLPPSEQVEFEHHLLARLPFFENDEVSSGIAYVAGQNDRYDTLNQSISPDGFRGITADKDFTIDDSIAETSSSGIGIETKYKIGLKLSNLTESQEDIPYKNLLIDANINLQPNHKTGIYQCLGMEKVVIAENDDEHVAIREPNCKASNDYIITLTNMGNAKGFNSVRSDVQKIIGILPSSDLEYHEDNSINYKPTYPLKVDLNNLEKENINNFTLQITTPDGKLATNLQNPTSLILRITEKDNKE